MQNHSNGRRGSRAFFASAAALVALGVAGLFTAVVETERTRGAADRAQAELAQTKLRIELERRADEERLARHLAEGALTKARRQLDDAERRLAERCVATAAPSRAGGHLRPVNRPDPGDDDDLRGLTELAPYVPQDDSADGDGTIHLEPDKKRR